ncbi:unnamed protein product [Clavelina lepadiformis]|uniref:Uncharacterized protein n=1 Tax=Clavelina lepadiformis TaxID=159417 RepID=A0ABP0GC87_CLALP
MYPGLRGATVARLTPDQKMLKILSTSSLPKLDVSSEFYEPQLQRGETRTPWRNGSASDSRSEGCVFKSRRGH